MNIDELRKESETMIAYTLSKIRREIEQRTKEACKIAWKEAYDRWWDVQLKVYSDFTDYINQAIDSVEVK